MAFELGGGFAGFSYVDAKGDSRFSFFGEPRLECGQTVRVWAETIGANRFAHGSQKSDRAFRDDDVHGGVIQLDPEKSVSGECRDGVDASPERSSEMIRVQRNGRFDHESVFIIGHYAQSHRARDRDLFVKKFFRGA